MRSRWFFRASKMPSAGACTGQTESAWQRQTLVTNAIIFIGMSGLAVPSAVYLSLGGVLLPSVLAAIGLTAGMAGLILCQRRLVNLAAAVEVYALLAMGLMLTVAESVLFDSGLAVALLAPLISVILGNRSLERQGWMAFALVFAAGGAAHLHNWMPDGPVSVWTSLAALLFGLILIGHSASRLRGKAATTTRCAESAPNLIDHTGEALVRFGSDGNLVMVSPAFEALLGCLGHELAEASLAERVHVADRPLHLMSLDAARHGKPGIFEVRIRQTAFQPGMTPPHFIWVEISLFPLKPSSGEHYDVAAVMRDITKRKDREADLVDARRLAEDVSAAKSRLLATLGHELGAPLNAVAGFSEMMTAGIGGTLSSTHREYAGMIHQSGKHLLDVTRMLLDVSALEAGKLQLRAQPFLIEGIVAPCLGMLAPAAAKRGVAVVSDIGKGLPLLFGDERACRQILINLLSNAIKFSREGGTVVVSLKRQGTAINLSVRDQGIGMAPESVERIGEAFFQARGDANGNLEGSGLGLSIVKGLVDLHEGTFRVMSEIGAGTSVTVLLPINGPAIKSDDTANVTPIRKEPSPAQSSWQDEKRKAQ